MSTTAQPIRIIVSGGGSGGHIFPAVAIANAFQRRHPDAEILFVGAEGRMEMEKVPAAGYRIEGLPIAGLQRQLTLRNIGKNLLLPVKVLRSRVKARRIIRRFQPQVVVGVGGFASEPTLKAATGMGVATLLQEQNSYAGLTNRTLARKARTICVAYDGMERFFPADKIVFTGNPVRADIEHIAVSRDEGCAFFGVDASRPVVLSVGGSLGASSINRMVMQHLDFFRENNIQLVWQTGRWMYDEAVAAVQAAGVGEWVKVHQFVTRMDMAYAAANAIISRAGAIAISELCLVGKPIILIPSPNVAEDHQTKNAMALVNKGAALMVPDKQCGEQTLPMLVELLSDKERCAAMARACRALGVESSADRIVDEIEKLMA